MKKWKGKKSEREGHAGWFAVSPELLTSQLRKQVQEHRFTCIFL